ncbi:hypothetical protein D3C87_2058700 [compost metagenome]
MRPEVGIQRLARGNQCCLARAVGRRTRQADEAGGGGDDGDVSAAAGEHLRHGGFQAMDRAEKVQIDDR